jgi:ribosomal protein S18 acetylase RimI-like enzyme
MLIQRAEPNDLAVILSLQYLAYQSEARLINDWTIQPLTQTLREVEAEYQKGVILKAIDDAGQIIGSVRGHIEDGTCHIGKLIVNPEHQRQGIGTKLLRAIEEACPRPRYELFTSSKSLNNLRLYERLGYKRYREREASPGLTIVYLEKSTG